MPHLNGLRVLALAACSAVSHAEVVFSTLGPNDAYDPTYMFLAGSVSPTDIEFGFRFSPSRTGHLTQFRGAVFRTGGTNALLRVSLRLDDGSIPGPVLASWDASPPRVSNPTSAPVWTLSLNNPVLLRSDRAYFLTIRALSPMFPWQWHAAGTPSSRIRGVQVYRWNASSAWVQIDSDLAAFELSAAPPCTADVDDGSGSGTPDGGVTIDDLLYYLALYADGSIAADVDDGTATGTPDGGVTIDDLLYFILRYERGC